MREGISVGSDLLDLAKRTLSLQASKRKRSKQSRSRSFARSKTRKQSCLRSGSFPRPTKIQQSRPTLIQKKGKAKGLATSKRLSIIVALFHGDLPITEMHRGTERTSYIPFLLNPETLLDKEKILSDIQEALEISKWRETVTEEMRASEKNGT